MSSASCTPVSPDFVHNVSGDDRQPVGQDVDSGASHGSSSTRMDHGPSPVEGEPQTEEEAQPQRLVKTPYTPTAAEMAEHRANGHLPYRCWCPDCVEGFGREWAHAGLIALIAR